MGSAADRLLGHLSSPDRYDIPPGEIRAVQIEAQSGAGEHGSKRPEWPKGSGARAKLAAGFME